MPTINHPASTVPTAADFPQEARQGEGSATPWAFSIATLLLGGSGFITQSVAFSQSESSNTTTRSTDVLPQVEVRAQKDEAVEGYKAEVTRSTKQLQNPHAVPQAITSVPRSLMTEQQAGSVKEALRNESGLTRIGSLVGELSRKVGALFISLKQPMRARYFRTPESLTQTRHQPMPVSMPCLVMSPTNSGGFA